MVSLELNLMNDNFEHKCPGNVVRFLQYIKYLELIKISFVYVWTLINVSLNTFLPCRTLIKPLFNFSPVKYSPPLIWCIKVIFLKKKLTNGENNDIYKFFSMRNSQNKSQAESFLNFWEIWGSKFLKRDNKFLKLLCFYIPLLFKLKKRDYLYTFINIHIIDTIIN